jgi:hypothetical protein
VQRLREGAKWPQIGDTSQPDAIPEDETGKNGINI